MTTENGQRSLRHHYVPRFYLERFADQKGRLNAYQRNTRKRIKTSAANLAVESDLYTIIDVEGDPSDHAEKIIADIETRLGVAARRKISSSARHKGPSQVGGKQSPRRLVGLRGLGRLES